MNPKPESKTAAEWASSIGDDVSYGVDSFLLNKIQSVIQAAIWQARAEEREECAKVCEDGTPNLTGSYKDTALHCAQLIRQRK